MRNSSLHILEIIWITTGILCIAASVRSAITGDGSKVIIFAAMAIVSFLFAWLRHKQRKKR